MHDVIIGSAKQECVKKRVKYVVYFTLEPGIRLRIIQHTISNKRIIHETLVWIANTMDL